MALSFTCDGCSKEGLNRADIIQITVQSNDPEGGITQARQDFCLKCGDGTVNAIENLGFELE